MYFSEVLRMFYAETYEMYTNLVFAYVYVINSYNIKMKSYIFKIL